MARDNFPGSNADDPPYRGFFERAAPFALLRADGWQQATTGRKPARPHDAQRLSHWLLERVCRGQKYFESATKLAARYERRGKTPAERVAALVRAEVGRGFGVGFAAGLTGPLAAPITIPVSLATTWLIQARLVAAIAVIFGHDIDDEAVRTAILMALSHEDDKTPKERREGGMEALGAVWRQASGPALNLLQRRASKALFARTQPRRLVKLARALPILGAAAGGTVDAYSCLKVAARAQGLFQPTSENKATSP